MSDQKKSADPSTGIDFANPAVRAAIQRVAGITEEQMATAEREQVSPAAMRDNPNLSEGTRARAASMTIVEPHAAF